MKKYKRNKNEKEYIPRYPEKYCGTYPIICRSGWEERFCHYLDYNKRVLEWSSENHRIGYIDPYSGRKRVYYPDYYAKFEDKKRYIIEVKPTRDLKLPTRKNKSQKTMAIREQTYHINKAKFKAAENYCKKLGMNFIVITEKDLFRGN